MFILALAWTSFVTNIVFNDAYFGMFILDIITMCMLVAKVLMPRVER